MKKLSLEEYIRTTPQHNIQTKLLAGQQSGYDFLAGECTADTLSVAKENLARHFSLVGLTERFEESLALAKILFGWKIPYFVDFNVTGRRPSKSSVPSSVREMIADYYRYDVELYRYAAALFDQAVAQHGDEIRAELDAIRQARRHGRVGSLAYRAWSMTRHTICRLHSTMLIL